MPTPKFNNFKFLNFDFKLFDNNETGTTKGDVKDLYEFNFIVVIFSMIGEYIH